jgi:hypothetical protein
LNKFSYEGTAYILKEEKVIADGAPTGPKLIKNRKFGILFIFYVGRSTMDRSLLSLVLSHLTGFLLLFSPIGPGSLDNVG